MSRSPWYRATLLACLLSVGAGGSPADHLHAQAPAIWSDLVPGPYGAGYRLRYVHDPSRTAAFPPRGDTRRGSELRRGQEAERIVPLRIWYPAAPDRGARRVRYREYLEVRPDTGFHPAVADSLRERTLGILRYAAWRYASAGGAPASPSDTAGLVEGLLDLPGYASRGAPPAPGRFPVVVFAGGAYHSVDENVVLWEYLASHGYVVAAFPSVGIGSAGLPVVPAGLETMARDVETVIAFLERAPFADRTRLAAAGFSFGGAAALVAAARNAWIDAVAGLDPSFIAGRHVPTVRSAPLFFPQRVGVPLLEFHRADTTVSYEVVDSVHSAAIHGVEFADLDHIDFNSYAMAYGAAMRGRRIGPSARRDSLLAVKSAAYRGMATVFREFLDAYVKGEPAAERRLHGMLVQDSPVWSGVPPGDLRFRRGPPDEIR